MSESPSSVNIFSILKKANMIGLGLFIAFLLVAAVLYFLMGLIGWDSSGLRAMAALFISPLLLGGLGGMAWLVWRSGQETQGTASNDEDNHDTTV